MFSRKQAALGGCLHVAPLLCSVPGSALHAGEPIVLFDLRYTLGIDPADPAQVRRAWDHAHAVATLQGIVNRERPTLYVRFVDSQTVGGKNIDDYWLEKLRAPGRWLGGREIETVSDIVGLVEKYRASLRGAVVYDPKVPATSNLASTIAGVEDLIAERKKGTFYFFRKSRMSPFSCRHGELLAPAGLGIDQQQRVPPR